MKNIHYIIAGFISYFFLEVIAILHAYVTGRPPIADAELTKLLGIMLFMSFPMGILGCLLGYLFKFFQKYIVGLNIYYQGIVYFIVTTCLFSTMKGIAYIMSSEFLIAQIYAVISGAFFIWLLNVLSIKNAEKQTT